MFIIKEMSIILYIGFIKISMSKVGPLTKYLLRAMYANSFIVTNFDYQKDKNEEGIDFYVVQANKLYGGNDIKFLLMLDEDTWAIKAKDKHNAYLYIVCRFKTKELLEDFLKESNELGVKDDEMRVAKEANKTLNAIFYREQVKITNIRLFAKQIGDAENVLCNLETVKLYLSIVRTKGNNA